MTVAFDLHAYRVDRGLTQADVAEATGVHRGTIIRLERGGRPLPDTALKIARWVGRPPSELWPRDDAEAA